MPSTALSLEEEEIERQLDQLMAKVPGTICTETRNPYQCRECGGDMLMVEEGAACLVCGLLDAEMAISVRGEDLSYADRRNPPRVHRYSRLVHMKDYLNSLCGLTRNVLSGPQLATLLAAIDGEDYSPRNVLRGLRRLGIQKRHRKRVFTLSRLLGGFVPVEICPGDLVEIYKRFLRVELAWNHHHREIAPGRRVFFNYGFVFQQIVVAMGKPHYARDVQTMKNTRLRRRQTKQWERLLSVMNLQARPYNKESVFSCV